MVVAYVPEAGEIVWMSFDPQIGREQAGTRPALILSPSKYNERTSLVVCCPLTTQIKGYPFEVVITTDPPSVVLVDQVRSFDWRGRNARPKGVLKPEKLAEVVGKLHALLASGLRSAGINT
ncbi:MAG: endoribonuclease MazF [Acidobacteria bacterium]|nr:endoribonuclease MazF [Acidobacteriota bacterium]